MKISAIQYGSWANIVGWRVYADLDCWLVQFVGHVPAAWAISYSDEWKYEFRW